MVEIPIKTAGQSSGGDTCSESEPFALQVLGDSMEPEFPDKCIIIIEPFEMKIPDTYVFVELEGSKWFRQYKKDDSGREYLYACNDTYPDIDLKDMNWKVLGLIRQRNIKREVKHYSYTGHDD
jgi:phage repressor protein C with HTH and peptisase S24 domain